MHGSGILLVSRIFEKGYKKKEIRITIWLDVVIGVLLKTVKPNL